MTTDTIITGNSKEILRGVKTGTADIYKVPAQVLKVRPGFNAAREVDPDYMARVREIADSIKANGFYTSRPIEVTCDADGNVWVSDGHTRLAGALLAISEGHPLESVPVINEARGTNEIDRAVGKIKKNRGTPLTPYGEALVVKELLGLGVDEAEVSRRLGYENGKIKRMLDLLEAPAEVRELVVDGKVSMTLALETVKKRGAQAGEVLKDAVATAQATGRTKASKKHLAAPQGTYETPASVAARLVHGKLPVTMRNAITFEQVEAVITIYRKGL